MAYISDYQVIVIWEKRQYLKKKKGKLLNTIYRQTIANTKTLTYYSCVTIIDKLTGQASSPIGRVARGHARAASERRREYERRERNPGNRKALKLSPLVTLIKRRQLVCTF